MREVEPLADLPVRESFGDELRDLELLGRQLVAHVGSAPTARLAGCESASASSSCARSGFAHACIARRNGPAVAVDRASSAPAASLRDHRRDRGARLSLRALARAPATA